MPSLAPAPKFQAFDDDGNPLVGGKLYTYEPSTLTDKTTYNASGVANTNPIILDARGECDLYLAGATKLVLKTSTDVTLWSVNSVADSSVIAWQKSVSDHGADTTGAVSAVAAFQAAVDATTNSGVQVIHVPRGTYSGDLSTVAVGSRTVVWAEEGGVTYSTAAPPGNRSNTKYSGDTTRPWYYGHNAFVDDTTAGDSNDRPTLRVQRTANHTGGSTSVNASAISSGVVINQTAGRVDNFENAYVGQVDTYRSDTVTGAPNISVYQGTVFKHNPSTGVCFGSNFVARDQTGRKSSVSLGGMIGCEIDVVASGPDDATQRIGLDVIARGYDVSSDGATSVYAGLRVRPANSGVLSSEPVALTNGILVEPGTLGSLVTGIIVDGAASTAHMEVSSDTATAGVLRVGSKRSTAVQTGRVDMIGRNASGVKTAYGQMICTIVTATAGAEDGALAFNTQRAGVNTAEATIAGGMILGSPTGSFKGVGTLNATAVYDDNVLLTCYVLEAWQDGKIDLAKWDMLASFDANVPKKHAAAAGFSAVAGERLDTAKWVDFLKINKRLPAFPGPEKWAEDGTLPVGGLLQRLWETVEVLSVHVAKLHERLAVLEGKAP